jgi:hypothetical protein
MLLAFALNPKARIVLHRSRSRAAAENGGLAAAARATAGGEKVPADFSGYSHPDSNGH